MYQMKACVLNQNASFPTPFLDIYIPHNFTMGTLSSDGSIIRLNPFVSVIENRGRKIVVCKSNSSLERCYAGNSTKHFAAPGIRGASYRRVNSVEAGTMRRLSREVKVLELKRDFNSVANIYKSSCPYKLRPVIDIDGILRMDGRQALSEVDSVDKEFTIILPRQHAIIKIIIRSYHEKFRHANRE